MEELMLRRTRAKTPVFCVGQLESKRDGYDASVLAQNYQALLPPRLMSPFIEVEWDSNGIPNIQPCRTIRKVKRQGSLRSLMKKHSRAASISDTETLVGSESPKSPISPWLPDFEVKNLDDDTETSDVDESSTFDNDMALKKCMELLSSELSTTLAEQQQPLDQVRQSSGLQILVMIESYEKVQQHLRQEIRKSHAIGEKDKIQDVERILEYWLKVLYSVYDRTYEISKEGNEDYFPPPLSVMSTQKRPTKSILRKPLRPISHISLMDSRTQQAQLSF